MKLFRKGKRNAHRGIIGMEAAIVLIAFVIVAAALAFVVLNMGFTTTQKAKTTITSTLKTASNSIIVSGKVIGHSSFASDNMTTIMIPLKLTVGGEIVDLNTTRATISFLAAGVQLNDIYTNGCTLTGEFATATAAWAAAGAAGNCIAAPTNDPISGGTGPVVTSAIIYWAVDDGDADTKLEPGEHAVMSLGFNRTNDAPGFPDKITIELTLNGESTLTVERNVPLISGSIINLS